MLHNCKYELLSPLRATANTETNEALKDNNNKHGSERELISPNGDKRYVRRNEEGEFTESQDDVSRSLSHDVRQHAKNTVSPGHGDEGDQKRNSGSH